MTRRLKFFTLAGTIVVIALLIGSIAASGYYKQLFGSGGAGSTNPAKGLTWGQFTQISRQDYGNTTQVYYVSWYGCPIGAADSWAFYAYFSRAMNMSSYVSPHYSDPYDSFPNTPGVIFEKQFTVGGVWFHPLYVYNQYMNQTTGGLSVNRSDSLELGISLLQSELPQEVYSLERSAMETLPTFGMPGNSANISSGTILQHVNTNVIVLGPKGAWILNGPLFTPEFIYGQNADDLLAGAFNNSEIQTAASLVGSVIQSD